ncbi:kinase-like domain-containing protein [Mycena sp. CBHHK59/15]|nr:kinase-like domain-containing protein [Mycena sp. CBHHK59/15]
MPPSPCTPPNRPSPPISPTRTPTHPPAGLPPSPTPAAPARTHRPRRRPRGPHPQQPARFLSCGPVHVFTPPGSTRSYTELKSLGDGSFGTVWLCDWHGNLPPNTPLSPMQCGAGAKPQWVGKRLVAVKRMRKKWEGGWDECQRLKELESLRAIPFHPNIIPLYDFFLQPDSKELYFVFEPMEGNLYHLVKARKGRPFAGGLISSIFRQMVSGLEHIHSSGYFHRDMKPENVLVTTTGLHDYASLSPTAPPNAPPEKDVVAIIKLADFGLAREIRSQPPYTVYVSTRWYRAPEVLLMSNNYSSPVDMWALGTIMAELINLRPLFPGQDTMDQLARICEVLGDPSDSYGYDANNNPIGGGPWPRGVQMAASNGFVFRRTQPKNIYALFPIEPHYPAIPVSLVHCIRDLLKYEPEARLTSRQCLDHAYLRETTPRNNIPLPPGLRAATSLSPLLFPRIRPLYPPRLPNMRVTYGCTISHHQIPQTSSRRNDVVKLRHHDYPVGSMDIQSSPIVQEFPARPNVIEPMHDSANGINVHDVIQSQTNKLGKLGSLSFGKKHSKWGLGGMFGGDKSHQNGLPPLEEMQVASTSTPSLKRSQSSSTDSKSLREPSPIHEPPRRMDAKKNKKEAERIQREAEKQRRALAEKMHREQARAVMQKRNQMMQKTAVARELEWDGGTQQRLEWDETLSKGKQAALGPVRQNPAADVVNAAAGRFVPQPQPEVSLGGDWRRDTERMAKARRREFDDDHSMSSSDVHSIGRMSSISFATVDSDPGPSRIRNRPSLLGMSRMTSSSSLQTSFDDFPPSARSSNSFSLEGQLAHDFRARASFDNGTPLTGNISPPPMQMLSLSPSQDGRVPYLQHPLHPRTSPMNGNTFEFGGQLLGRSYSPYGHPSSPGAAPKSAINPMFKVVSRESNISSFTDADVESKPPLPGPPPGDSPSLLPPFSQLDAVAGDEYGEYTSPPVHLRPPEAG